MTWRARVRLGDLDLEAVQDPDGDGVATLPALLDLRVTDELDDQAQGWPRPQGPSTAAVTLLMATAAEAAEAIQRGDQVAIRLYVEDDLVNQAVNPGAEVNVTSIRRLGAAVGPVTRDTTRDHNSFTGVASARVVVTATGSLGTIYDLGAPVGQVVAGPGDRVTGGVWVRPEATSTWHPYVNGPRISTGATQAIEPTPAQDVVCPANTWTWVPVDITVPADHQVFRAGVRHKGNAPAVGFAYNTDDALFLVNAPETVEAFNGDGDQVWPLEGGYDYEWTGTPHASTSRRLPWPAATFYGRASDPVLKPHDRGVLVQVTCVDYLPDLAADTVGSADRPAEDLDKRFAAFGVDDYGIDYLYNTDPDPDPSHWSLLAARSGSAAPLLQVLQESLASAVWYEWRVVTEGGSHYEHHVFELRPNVDPDTLTLDAAAPWVLEALERTPTAPVGAVLAEVGGVWTLVADHADPLSLPALIPARYTDFDATWTRRPAGDINTVDVVHNGGESVTRVSTWSPGQVRVTDRRETLLANDDTEAADYGLAYLPDPALTEVPGHAWEAERFVVLLDEAGAPYGWWPGNLRETRLVSGLQAHQTPDGRTFWPGVIAFREWRIASGECEVEVGLVAQPMDSWQVISPETTPAAVTPDTIDPDLTVADMALVRPSV